MLVLSRLKGDAIVIGNDIVVEVVEIRGDKVRLGIVCPQETTVHRQEIWALLRDEGIGKDPSKSSPANSDLAD